MSRKNNSIILLDLCFKIQSLFTNMFVEGDELMEVTVKQIQPEETYPIRHKVLRPDEALNSVKYESDSFMGSFHLGAYIDDKLISIASFLQEEHSAFDEMNQYRLNGMATLESYRNKGIGSQLLKKGESILKKKHARLLWCNAKYPVSNYYLRFGLREYGEVFVIDSIGPHKLMFKKL